MLPVTIRKKTITAADLEFIQSTIYDHWDNGRTYISKVICEKWQWRQPNGRLKDMACREVLLTLYRNELIDYPAGVHDGNNKKRNKSIAPITCDQTAIQLPIAHLKPLKFVLARNTEYEPLYRSLINQHHYLGYRQIVGNHLTYIAFSGDRPVACLGWGSAAWSVKSRDAFIGWDKS